MTDRFRDKYFEDVYSGCFRWIASIDSDGYGYFGDQKAHRVAWMFVNGPIPAGMYVCHKCDNPSCVNPAHLFLGTATDNMQDCVSKRRIAVGERHGLHKLTDDDVLAIRQSSGTQREIASRFGVSQNTIMQILKGRIWKRLLARESCDLSPREDSTERGAGTPR